MNLSETDALVTWNYLTEPGDQIAWRVLSKYGAVEALDRLIGEFQFELDEVSQSDIRDATSRWKPRFQPENLEKIREEASRQQLGLLTPKSDKWPESFQSLGRHQPLVLWYRGALGNLNTTRSVAVVGSRIASHYGQKVTGDLVSVATNEGASVISGGALGIDTVAHRTALSSGGKTTAVMAGGLSNLYPAANLSLFDEISHSGLLISEMTPLARPTRWRFLQRNRLIAAITQATVVTEAGWRSGSINTAGHAYELDRPVFAIPGNINSPQSAGCNRLIANGTATALIDTADLPTLMGWTETQLEFEALFGPLEMRVRDFLSIKPKSNADLAASAGMTLNETSIALGSLELAGLAKRLGGNLWAKVN